MSDEVANEVTGVLIACPECGSEMATEHGGQLWHNYDGSHDFIPPQEDS